MTTAEKTVYQKAVEVITNVAEYMDENDADAQEAWEAVRNASNLTEEQMVQCALVATQTRGE